MTRTATVASYALLAILSAGATLAQDGNVGTSTKSSAEKH